MGQKIIHLLFTMKISEILLAFMALKVSKPLMMKHADDDNRIVSEFIGELVNDVVSSDPAEGLDVVLLRIENELKNELFEQIAKEISPAVLWNVDCYKPIKTQI